MTSFQVLYTLNVNCRWHSRFPRVYIICFTGIENKVQNLPTTLLSLSLYILSLFPILLLLFEKIIFFLFFMFHFRNKKKFIYFHKFIVFMSKDEKFLSRLFFFSSSVSKFDLKAKMMIQYQ